jgi:hypothetical protein
MHYIIRYKLIEIAEYKIKRKLIPPVNILIFILINYPWVNQEMI